jgi:hypothetical protein
MVITYEPPFDVVEISFRGRYLEFRDSKGGQRVEKLTEWLFTNESLFYDGNNNMEGSTISP